MRTAQIADAIAMIEESTLFDILEERYKRINRMKDSDCPVITVRRISFAVAALAACFLVAIFAVSHLISQPNSNNYLDTPQYVAAFSSPELAALYKEYPYSEILPQKVPETLAFASSYKTTYDPIANPNNEQYLSLTFSTEKTNTSLEVKVVSYDGSAIIADPQKPETYDLAPYYSYLETPGAVGADAPKVLGLFRAEDISKQLVEKRIYVFADGLCKAEIEVLCGEYVVAYQYVGAELSAQLFCDMITSAHYFIDTSDSRSVLDRNYTQLPKNEPAYVPMYSTPTMEQLYNETPFDMLLPRKMLPNCDFFSSYKVETDPVANPKNKTYLSVIYQTSISNGFLEISISDQLDNVVLADLNNPSSYDLSQYYKTTESDSMKIDRHQYFSAFKPEALSEYLMESRIHQFDDGLCKANIDIICGSYLVSYNYTGPAITPVELYAMVTSAQWFS